MDVLWFCAGLACGFALAGLVVFRRRAAAGARAPYIILDTDVRGRRAGEPLPSRYYWRAVARGEITPPAFVPTPEEMDLIVARRRSGGGRQGARG